VDHYFQHQGLIYVVEAKLTETWVGFSGLNFLYRPILEMVYSKPTIGVQVCKHVNRTTGRRPLWDLEQVLAAREDNVLWHLLP
jgi:hypothetical protein